MDRKNTRKIGQEKEEAAAEYLRRRGVRILEKNFRCRSGEIDLIGQDGEYLVFAEVKYRASATGRKTALEAVSPAKQKQICRVFDFYRAKHKLPETAMVRFDAIGIDGEEIDWVKNAFWYRR